MNYFEFFDLDINIDIDSAILKQKFYENSRKYHPDFYTLSTDSDKEEALKMSAFNNDAYKTLKSERKRIKYILDIHNLLEEGNSALPQVFLMEMMDINEALMELEFEPNPEAKSNIRGQVEIFQKELAHTLNNIKSIFPSEKALNDLKDYYLKNQYLNRLLEKL